jgi:hypothetical protein
LLNGYRLLRRQQRSADGEPDDMTTLRQGTANANEIDARAFHQGRLRVKALCSNRFVIPEINYLAVLAAVVASMVVGFVFYHPAVLGRIWMRLVGHSEDSIQSRSPLVYPVVIVASFLTAWALAGATYMAYEFYQGRFWVSALITGWILWLAFTVARMLVHDLFDTRSLKITALSAFNEFLIITAMALVIGLWPPSAI